MNPQVFFKKSYCLFISKKRQGGGGKSFVVMFNSCNISFGFRTDKSEVVELFRGYWYIPRLLIYSEAPSDHRTAVNVLAEKNIFWYQWIEFFISEYHFQIWTRYFLYQKLFFWFKFKFLISVNSLLILFFDIRKWFFRY